MGRRTLVGVVAGALLTFPLAIEAHGAFRRRMNKNTTTARTMAMITHHVSPMLEAAGAAGEAAAG